MGIRSTETARRWLDPVPKAVSSKGFFYWLVSGLLLGIGMSLSMLINRSDLALHALKYPLHQRVTNTRPFQNPSGNTTVVLVDNVFFYGPNAGRVPLSPALIADLVVCAANAGATAVAIDFNLTLPDPNNPSMRGERFAAEVAALEEAIRSVSKRILVIVPVSLRAQGNGIEPSYLSDLIQQSLPNVRLGIANLPEDLRYLPGSVFDPQSGRLIEGLGIALGRSRVPFQAPLFAATGKKPPMMIYGREIDIVSATDLIGDVDAVRPKISGRVVIIGGSWTIPTRTSERLADGYLTPVGFLPGALVHGYVSEASINGQVLRPPPTALVFLAKLLALVFVSILMVTPIPLATKVAYVGSALFSQILFAYFSLIGAGLSFDIVIPALFILGHAAVDQINDWRIRSSDGKPLKSRSRVWCVVMLLAILALLMVGPLGRNGPQPWEPQPDILGAAW